MNTSEELKDAMSEDLKTHLAYFEHDRRIESHYKHAREKHPHFCDMLNPTWMTPNERSLKIAVTVGALRRHIKSQVERGCLMWDALLNCEIWEIHEAIECNQPEYAVEECYDAIAVLLRTIDVLEGRQKLGNPEKEGGSK